MGRDTHEIYDDGRHTDKLLIDTTAERWAYF